MTGEVVSISPDQVVGACARKKAERNRLVTMTCTAPGENEVEILYHFDRDLELSHLRLRVARGIAVPSISGVYFAAFLVENEIRDLFGVHFSGLAPDYEGTLYLDPEVAEAPFLSHAAKEKESPQ